MVSARDDRLKVVKRRGKFRVTRRRREKRLQSGRRAAHTSRAPWWRTR